MSYQIFNEASLGKFIELIKNKVKSIVDNATVASATNATNATNDADGNAIKTTYRKVADSYSKSEVDAKVGNSSSSIVITTDDLIANYKFAQLMTLLESGKAVYLKITDNDPMYTSALLNGYTLNPAGYNNNAAIPYNGKVVVWATTNDAAFGSLNNTFGTIIAAATSKDSDDSISIKYIMRFTNTFITVSTIDIAVSAWHSTSKEASVEVPGVTFDCAVDVAPGVSSFDDYVSAGIMAKMQGEDVLTFTCKTIPTKTISVNVKSTITKPILQENRNK